ncbi:MAG: hypothetical protein AAF446_05695 [Pseudomonadota bacterium]
MSTGPEDSQALTRRKKRVWLTVGLLFLVAAMIYFAFIGRGVFGWFA